MAKVLIVVGLILVGAGLAMKLGVPLGRLPGDLVVRSGNSTFYFPIVTCLLVSVLLSIVLMLLRR
jgi:predicted MFS family arabinose efflux permease